MVNGGLNYCEFYLDTTIPTPILQYAKQKNIRTNGKRHYYKLRKSKPRKGK